jgi:electron-transferring-flavoprotein dehydrogenase
VTKGVGREVFSYDVVIVGGGPSGLSAAIRLKQLSLKNGYNISVCVLEKGSEIGAHILSGACFDPSALRELFPDWMTRGAPLYTPATDEHFLLLTETSAVRLPVPQQMRNSGNHVISLGNLCRWLAAQAESFGVDVYPSFAAAEILFHNDGSVKGVATGSMGVGKDGQHTSHYQSGTELHARQTIFAEGCRGSLTQKIFERFKLRNGVEPQTYAIGFKELWEISPSLHQPGKVMHTIGWPLPSDTYGGSYLYHLENNQVAVGLIVGLDYKNPWLSPYEEFQRFKTHPAIRSTFVDGRRIAYGAKTLSEGGIQSIPKLTFPGGVLVGDAAGFLNVAKLKGSHTAMKSGMVAADAVYEHFVSGLLVSGNEVCGYADLLKKSWLWKELYRARNIRPAFRYGLWAGVAYSALDTYLLRGRAPWTFGHIADHSVLRNSNLSPPISYPKPDGYLTFDRLTSVFFSAINHAENQRCHLQLRDVEVPIKINYTRYAVPEVRYCPAGVYEVVDVGESKINLQINSQNCLHCKACDIKDPTQNICWTVPEGGSGPCYPNM